MSLPDEPLTIEPPKRSSPAPSRRLPSINAGAFRRHAQRVGMAVLAWNDLHANLYLIFFNLIGITDSLLASEQVAYNLWHVIQNDKTQRDMLQQAANAKLAPDKITLEKLNWILAQAQKLSTYRNIAAHTAIIFHQTTGDRPRADPWSSRSMAQERHRIIDHDKFWRLLAGDLSALSRYAARLADELWRPWRTGPSLRKPRLQSLPLIDQIEDQLSRDRQAAARARQKPSSPRKPRKGTNSKKRSHGA